MKQLLLIATLLLPCAAWSQEKGKKEVAEPKPTLIKTIFLKPQVEILENEDKATGHYEKWREKTMVIFANLSPQEKTENFVTETLKQKQFNLLVQSDVSKKDFKERTEELKKELESINSEQPKLKKWIVSSVTASHESTFPQQEWSASPKTGYTCYAWLYRVYEIEGARDGKRNMFKGTLTTYSDGPVIRFPTSVQSFDLQTGELTALKAKPAQ